MLRTKEKFQDLEIDNLIDTKQLSICLCLEFWFYNSAAVAENRIVVRNKYCEAKV